MVSRMHRLLFLAAFVFPQVSMVASQLDDCSYSKGMHPPGKGMHPPGKGMHKNRKALFPRPPPPKRQTPKGMAPMLRSNVDYCEDHVVKSGLGNDLKIRFDAACGSRFRSTTRFADGSFQADIKTAAGDTSGLVTSFYLSSLEGSGIQSEIDFEFLGKDKTKVQTNFYHKGVGGHEMMHDLGFDSSKAFHNYRIEYSKERIRWYVDSRLIREVLSRGLAEYPDLPVYLYASVWNAANINAGGWAGRYTGSGVPYWVEYKNVMVPSA